MTLPKGPLHIPFTWTIFSIFQVQTCEKRRSQSEKVGRLKYIIQLEKEQNKRLDRVECVLRILRRVLGFF